MQGRVLVIDDEPLISSLLQRRLRAEQLEVETAASSEAGLRRLREAPFDVVISDLHLPDIDGLEVLRRAHTLRPDCAVVLITGDASVETVRDAMKQGALDYLQKPFSVDKDLLPILRQVLVPLEPDEDVAPAREEGARARRIVGRNPGLQRTLERASKVARTDTPVLLLGESGTGKELLASLIHESSARSERPMLRANCAAFSESLLESELFGHVRGAFTGAHRDRDGVFAAADGGTLFLDEIGELSPAVQPKLLRVLQDGEIRRLGDPGRTLHVDVRIIAATNRDLQRAIERGTFREDLFYRLAVVPIVLPPLRKRMSDLPELIEHFLKRYGAQAGFSECAMDAMRSYAWPGNVRELANAIQHAVVLDDDGVITLQDLPAAIQEHAWGISSTDAGTLAAIEKESILRALARTSFNQTEAARVLGVTRRTLGYRISKYALAAQIEALQKAAHRDTGSARAPSKVPPRSRNESCA